MVITSLKSGVHRSWAAKRMIFIYYFANLFCGVLLIMPFRRTLNDKVSSTLLGDALGGTIDMNFLADFLFNHRDLGSAWFGLAIVVPVFYLLTNIFFSGGALSVFASEKKYSTALFWTGAAKYFGRFMRLWLMALPVFGLFFLLMLVEKGVTRLVFGADPYQNITYWAGWVRVGLFGVALLLSHMFFDYARLYSVLNEETRMRHAWWFGLKFMFGNLGKALLLVIIIALIGVVGLAIYNLLADRLAMPHALVVVALLLLQQIYVLFRMLMKLSAFAAQTTFYQAVSAAVPAAASATPDVAGRLPEGVPA